VKSTWSKVRRNILRLSDRIARKRAQQWVVRGENHLAQGALEETLECCKRSLSIYADLTSTYSLMTQALIPGDDYMAMLSRFHECLEPENYVEIGVGSGNSLALAKHDTKAVGIDPYPCIDKKIKSRAKLYPIPSDEFFKSYNLFEELSTSRLSLAFIDGLHRFEQVLKDLINLERYADKESIILIHDCLPITRLVAAPVRATGFWCGDVWKVIPCLKKYRPDLTIHVVPTRPSGLGIITNLDPNSTVLLEKISQIVTEYRDHDLDYDYLDLDKNRLLNIVPNLVPNDWQHIAQMLSLPSLKN